MTRKRLRILLHLAPVRKPTRASLLVHGQVYPSVIRQNIYTLISIVTRLSCDLLGASYVVGQWRGGAAIL